jgi:hypothetical protein
MEFKKQLKGWIGGIVFVIVVALGVIFQKQTYGTPSQKEILKKTEAQIVNHIKAQILMDQGRFLNEAQERGNIEKASAKAARELKKLKDIKVQSVECKRLDPVDRKERSNITRFFGTQKYLIKAGYTVGDSKSPRYITLELKASPSGNWQTFMTARTF